MHDPTRKSWVILLTKLPSLFLGLFLFAAGILATLYSDLGMSPWGVFHMGLAKHSPLTLGQATQLTGLVILMASCKLGIIPGLGSICNMLFIGWFIDLIETMGVYHTPATYTGRLLMLFLGIILIGWASYFYLRVELGAGPRDGLMEGLVKKLNKPVWIIRGSIELTALLVGFMLGGPVGIGTLLTAFTVGFSVQLAFKLGKYDPSTSQHMNLVALYRYLKAEPQNQNLQG